MCEPLIGAATIRSEHWTDFLLRTLPSVTPERFALWRATLAALRLRPSRWLRLPAPRRRRLAPLPGRAAAALEWRLPQWRHLGEPNSVAADLWLLGRDEPQWPDTFDTLGHTAPDWLIGWGDTALLTSPLVAVVGSRRITPEVEMLTANLVRAIADLGFGVVSGGADGVDTAAHRAALDSGGRTVFVLPEGLAQSAKFEARDRHDPERVCLVSATWPWQEWSTVAALARNRLIAALARAVIVVVARGKGGSLMTGETALRFNRPLLVLDHGTVGEHTAGNRLLLQRGATPLSTAAIAEGNAASALREALARAASPPPQSADLFDGLQP